MQSTDAVRCILQVKGHKVCFLPPQTSVYDAIALMAEKGIGGLPILQDGALVGFVSERDYARKVILQGHSSRDTSVREIMTSPVHCVDPDKTIEDCMRIMTENRVRHLPVVDGGIVIGIVSIGDLVKWIVGAQEETIQQLQTFIAGAYPG